MSQRLGFTLKSWIKDYGARGTMERAYEAIDSGKLSLRTPGFDLRGFADGLLGDQWAASLKTHAGRTAERGFEATEAVDPSVFSHIVGQLLIREVQMGYENPEFIGDRLFRTIPEPTTASILGPLLVPMVSNVLDLPEPISPEMPYPDTTVAEDWITLPAIVKWGRVLNVSLEAILQDRTGQLRDRAMNIGYYGRLVKEQNQLRVAFGLTNPFNWKNTAYNTYQTASPWINKITGQAVTASNFSILNNVEQLFAQMTDPYTGQMIEIRPNALVCMPESKYDFKNIIHATEVHIGQISNDPARQSNGPNPIDDRYPILVSKIARKLLVDSGVSAANVKNYWLLGEFQKAFAYRELIPWTVKEAPPLNPADFGQDIVLQVKTMHMGVPGVWNPRFAALSINA